MTNLAARRAAAAEANREAALAAFAAKKAEIDALIARLTAASDDHFGADPETVNWASVGSLEAIAAQLTEAARFANA